MKCDFPKKCCNRNTRYLVRDRAGNYVGRPCRVHLPQLIDTRTDEVSVMRYTAPPPVVEPGTRRLRRTLRRRDMRRAR